MCKKIGQQQLQDFIKECLVERSKSIDDVVIHCNKLKLFLNQAKTKTSKNKQQLISLKSDVGLFHDFTLGTKTRDGNFKAVFCHKNQVYPPALSDRGNLYLGTKSNLLMYLEDLSEAQTVAPVTDSVILDGVTQMLKPVAVKNFAEYASQIFIPYIFSQFQNTSCVNLVWDRYLNNILKNTTRAKCGKGVHTAPLRCNVLLASIILAC